MLSREFRRAVKLSFGRGWQLFMAFAVDSRQACGADSSACEREAPSVAGIEDFPLAALVDNCGFTAATFGLAHMQSDTC